MLAEYSKSRTEGLFAGATILARPVAHAGIHHDVVADRHAVDICSDSVDNSARVRTEHPRGCDRHAGESGNDEQIETIERGGANANAYFARIPELRHWKIGAKLEAIEPAVTGDRECLHEMPAEAVILRPLGKLASCGTRLLFRKTTHSSAQ